MKLTRQIKLIPTKQQDKLMTATADEYIGLINAIVDYFDGQGAVQELTSATVKAPLPSALKNQCISDAKSIYKKFLKDVRKKGSATLPILKKPVAVWNNQNYKVLNDHIEFPMLLNGKSMRFSVAAIIPKEMFAELQNRKLGTLRVTKKNRTWIAQIAYEAPENEPLIGQVMGVDLGLKCPAVCATESGKIKFVGNGRKNKYLRRFYREKRRSIGKAKKLKALKRLNNKEQRVMRDIDHKMSREIVNFAINSGVSTIKLENLANIRKATRKSRKNEHNLHTWSFYRLANYIEYKAKLAGITVEYVNPAYTSQRCPICGKYNHAEDRRYTCECGYHAHRDIVGAINICRSTEAPGNRMSA